MYFKKIKILFFFLVVSSLLFLKDERLFAVILFPEKLSDGNPFAFNPFHLDLDNVQNIALRSTPTAQTKHIAGTKDSDADIKVTLIRPLQLFLVGSNSLDFGEIYVAGTTQTYSITNQFGQKFFAVGQKDRYITINYSESVTLSNSAWVTQQGGGEISTLTFTSFPLVHTKEYSTWRDVTTVNQGQSLKLQTININGEYYGTFYFWAGGTLTVPGNKPPGTYTGSYQITIAY